MSFQSKGLWMSKDAGCLNAGDLTYDSASRIEPKRLHQWSMDIGEIQLYPNKKQAVELPRSSSFAGIQPSTQSPWSDVSGSIPSHLNDRLFQTDASGIVYNERNVPLINATTMNMERYPFGNASLFDLSMSQPLDDPKFGFNYGGIRKVKVSEVRDSENLLPISMRHSYTREASVTPTSHSYSKVDVCDISMGLTYGIKEDNVITLGESYGKEDGSFISMDQSFNKADGSTIALGHIFKGENTTTSTAISSSKADSSIMSMAENYIKGDNSVISMGNPNRKDDCVIAVSQEFNGNRSVSVSSNCYKGNVGVTSLTQSNSKGENHTLSSGHSFDNAGSNIISFGCLHDDADTSGRLSCSYDLLMGQASGQSSGTFKRRETVVSNANAVTDTAQIFSPGVESASEKKEDNKSSKKIPLNNFPSNVRSLLSTGILDDVPVKYVAWSCEEGLRGIIKGSGYLCGCQLCNFSKVINAYEFERHAGCKTKHPNNHIFCENGKTIYGIVQELRSTPQNLLFDAIQTITGSPINQKSFRLWKESFLAATRELQRIYGKDERYQSL